MHPIRKSNPRSSKSQARNTKSGRQSGIQTPNAAGSSGSSASFMSHASTHMSETTTSDENQKNPSANVKPLTKRIGFIGLGKIGSGMVKNLLNTGHKVTIWNRTPQKYTEFLEAGAQVAITPAELVDACEIICCCVADVRSAQDIFYGCCGVNSRMTQGKSYLEMSAIDAQTSQRIAESVMLKKGKYLEVRFRGSRLEAEMGSLVIMAAGDREVFDEFESGFAACGIRSMFLGEVGRAANLFICAQTCISIASANLANCLAVAENSGIDLNMLIRVLKLSPLNCVLFRDMCKAIIEKDFTPNMSVANVQKILALALKLGDAVDQPLHVTAVASEMYQTAVSMGFKHYDAAALYLSEKVKLEENED